MLSWRAGLVLLGCLTMVFEKTEGGRKKKKKIQLFVEQEGPFYTFSTASPCQPEGPRVP